MPGIVKQPSYIQYLVPVFIPLFLGIIGKLWATQTGDPGAWSIVLFTSAGFALGGAFIWKIASHRLHFQWTPAFYKTLAIIYFGISVIIITARFLFVP